MKKQQIIGLAVLLFIAAATAVLFGAEPSEGPADGVDVSLGKEEAVSPDAQSVLWSPDSGYAAIARTTQTQASVTIVEPESGRSCEVLLPDERPIPEDTFLPEDWGEWLDENTLLFTVGRDGEAQQTYRCFLGGMTDEFGVDRLTGDTYLQTTETIPGDWDFDHDGAPETVTLVTLSKPWSMPGIPAYALNIERQDGTVLWTQEASTDYTAGYRSVFACRIDGQDYLLQYFPSDGQGIHVYAYWMFSLDGQGNEVLLRENQVEFDLMFGAPIHGSFDPAAIAAFLEEVHGYLDESTLLLSTYSGDLHTGVSGADFREDLRFWDAWSDGLAYDEHLSLEENLRALEAHRSK